MKLYQFNNKDFNKQQNKFYKLASIKLAIINKHNWLRWYDNIEIIEYEAKEVRRLTVEEVKQLNNKNYKDKVIELLELASNKDIGVNFFNKNTGEIRVNRNFIEFNSIDEAIRIVTAYQ